MRLGFHGEQPAHTRANAHANAMGIVWGDREAGVGESLLGSHHAEFAETIPAFGVFGLNEATGIKTLDFSSEATACCAASNKVIASTPFLAEVNPSQ
tara:strand:- start:1582 stop:1872 length:291 start_codon:yes stop_codon:yes gene_type:complete